RAAPCDGEQTTGFVHDEQMIVFEHGARLSRVDRRRAEQWWWIDRQAVQHVREDRQALSAARGVEHALNTITRCRCGAPPELGQRDRSHAESIGMGEQLWRRTVTCAGRRFARCE